MKPATGQDASRQPPRRPVPTDEAAGIGQEYLTFTIGAEHYAIDILKVQEIRGYEPPTAIANAPAFLKGVIDLRGIVVPIIDMRIRFKAEVVDYTTITVVIILSIGGRLVGIVVDGVSDVTTLRPEQIRPAPEFGASVDADFIVGMASIGDHMLVMVDIEQLMFNGNMGLPPMASGAA